MRARMAGVAALVGALSTSGAIALPKHPICGDLGSTLGVGIPSYSASIDWPDTASTQYGVEWKFLDQYVVPNDDPANDVRDWLRGKAARARALGAIPIYTFYQLLQLGQNSGMTGSEPEVVAQALRDPTLMRKYFDDFVFLLQTLASESPPVIIHVEPDSWGFMSWAMGVEGNADPTTVAVQVGSSGHPDLVGLADHAGGLGKALLHLRDVHGPEIRLGWHASNFRVGTRPEVTVGFYSAMGEWDVLLTDSMHLEGNEATWWEPWDPARIATNLDWLSTVSQQTRLPILMWQSPIGTTDWHLFDSQPEILRQMVSAGLGGVLFDLRGSGNPDSYRAFESSALATVPPSSSRAGGTAADLRARLAAYSSNPLGWPSGSPCAKAGTLSPTGGSSVRPSAADAAVTEAGGASANIGTAASQSGGSLSSLANGSPDSGCGCRVIGDSESRATWYVTMISFLFCAAQLRRRTPSRTTPVSSELPLRTRP